MARAVEVEGLRELRLELRRAEPRVGKELRAANLEAAQFVVPFVRRRAPRGPHEGGGTVRPIVASVRALASQRAGQVAVGGATTPHALPIEFGGTLRRHASQARTTVIAQPYLYPGIAAAQRDPEFVDFYGDAIERALARAFPKRA